SILSQSHADDLAERAAGVLIKLCVSGGTISRVYSSANQFNLESDKGNFTVEKREAQGLVDGIGAALNNLSADQANRARERMHPYIGQILALITPDLYTQSPPLPNQVVIESFSVHPENDPELTWLKIKIERNLVDFFIENGVPVTHRSSTLLVTAPDPKHIH